MFDARQQTGAPPEGAAAALREIERLVEYAATLATATRSCDSWTGVERGRALRSLDRLAGVLATARAGLLVAERAALTSIRPGDRDFTSARARVTRTGLGEARREVLQAETLATLAAVASAVSDGRVPLPHVDALARATAGAGEQARETLTRPDVQAELVGLAQRQTVKEFSATVARMVAEQDPDTLERGAAAQHRARFFVMSHQADGTYLRGRLDRLAGESLRVAIASVGQAPDADRDKPQADADALVALAERAVSGAAGVRARRTDDRGLLVADPEQDAADARVSGVAGRPTVSLLVPAETFAELRAARQRGEAAVEAGEDAEGGAGASATMAWEPVPPATLEDGTPVAMSQLARAMCDCEIGRIVINADGLPLDLGRTQRLYTGAQRRAVIVRDRQCAWNGCDVPAAYCEVHHIRWWERDLGPTSVENGVLLCSHHHHVVHELDLTIQRLGRPPGRGGGARVGEPVRYAFRRGDGRVLSAPPGGGDAGRDGRGCVGPRQGELEVA
jgi:hypothetical protein